MKTNLKVYTLTGAGTEIANFNVEDTYEKYIIKGSATSIGNYAISVTGTPQAGDTFIVKYKGVLDITTNGNTFSILGQSLTQNQLISDLDIEAYYDGSAWIVEIKPSFTSAVVENAQVVSATLANSKLAPMAAYTIKANNTGSSAVPQDVDACTLMARCAWLLSGNAGTDPVNDFIGTTDGDTLNFRVNNLRTQHWDLTLQNFITASEFNNNTTGYNNISINGLHDNTSGFDNTAIGGNSLGNNTTGSSNSGLGAQSLDSNTTGTSNTGVGRSAGFTISTGSRNTFLGVQADSSTSNGVNRIAIGYQAEADQDYQFALPDDVTKFKWRGVTYTLPSADGTAGQSLKTDGSGTLYWG